MKKILIADDVEDIRVMMRIMLQMYGYEVVEAADGYEAVEKAVFQAPDLILMDIAMPLMDGVQATAMLRKHEQHFKTPIIAVTAYGDFYAEEALMAGCNQVLTKPIVFEDLKPLLDEYLQ